MIEPDEKEPSEPASIPQSERLELDRLDSLVSSELRFAEKSARSAEQWEELAEDMLRLMEWVKELQSKQQQLGERLEQLHTTVEQNSRFVVTEIDKIRRELLGDRKAMVARSAFNALLPSLDSLRLMQQGITEESVVYKQLSALISSLTNIIQSFGFVEFQALPGESFDPARMENLGYAEGASEGVVSTVRAGYIVGDMVVRPCGVLIARPKNEENGAAHRP